ncbi:MAG: hypothetical protein ACOX2K_04260 [Bacillota bacterium]
MSQHPRRFDSRLALLTILVLAMGGALYGHGFMASSGLGPTPGVVYESIDSSACIACHTNESVISMSTVGQGAVVENTGG